MSHSLIFSTKIKTCAIIFIFSWHRVAIVVSGNDITAWLDCDAAEPKKVKRTIPTVMSRDGLVFIGRDLVDSPLYRVSIAMVMR